MTRPARAALAALACCAGDAAAAAQHKGDFGAIPICSSWQALPAHAIPSKVDCDLGRPLADCTFSLAGGDPSIFYELSNSRIITTSFRFEGQQAGPFGLTPGDGPAAAAAKLKARLGTEIATFEDPSDLYLQSTPLSCATKQNFRVFVMYGADRRISVVSLSMLPAI